MTRHHVVEPPLFLLGVAASLERGIRERRIDRTVSEAVMRALGADSFEEIEPHAFAAAAFELAPATGLPVPDASYLEVVRARDTILITADRRQLGAAGLLGLPAVGRSEIPSR